MKFNVTVQNRNITIEAPNKAALPDAVEEVINSPEFQNVPEIQPKQPQPFLPGLEKTERRIEARRKEPSGFEQARDIAREPITMKDVFDPSQRIARTLIPAAGEVFRRGEAAVAEPLLERQKGTKIFEMAPGGVPKFTKEGFESIKKGITGERRTELGDPIRATGVGGPLNEAIAATVGFSATLGLTNLATSGKLVSASNKASAALKEARSIKTEKRARFFTERGTRLRTAVQDILTAVKKEFDVLYNRTVGIGAKKVSPEESALAQEFLERLSPATISRYNRRIGERTGVKLGQKGKPTVRRKKGLDPETQLPTTESLTTPGKTIPPQDIAEVKALKDIISDSVPNNVWSGAEGATQAQAIAMGDTMELAEIIAANAGKSTSKLLSLNDKFSRLSKFRSQISSITTKSKQVKKATTLKNIRKTGQEGELEILTDFSNQFFPETETILKEIDAFNRTEAIGKFGRRVVSPENILRVGIIGALRKSQGKSGGQGFDSITGQ